MLDAEKYIPKTIYDIVYHSERSKEAIEEIVEGWIPFPAAGKNGIILWGVNGTGKTALAKMIPDAIEKRLTGRDAWENFMSVKSHGTGLAVVNQIEEIANSVCSIASSYHYFILDEVDLLGKEGMESLK